MESTFTDLEIMVILGVYDSSHVSPVFDLCFMDALSEGQLRMHRSWPRYIVS